jgi:hypothetical protein
VRLDPPDLGLADYQERYSLTASLVAVILGCVIFVVGVAGGFIVGLVRQAVPLGDLVRSPGFWGFVARGWDLDMIALQRSVWMYGPHVRVFDFR